jgi:hypothetical protein
MFGATLLFQVALRSPETRLQWRPSLFTERDKTLGARPQQAGWAYFFVPKLSAAI